MIDETKFEEDGQLSQLGPTRPFLKIQGDNITGTKRPTTYMETVMHCIKGYVGSGIFAMGAAFMNSGILLGPILMMIIAVVCLHCQHILIKACVKITEKETVPVLPSFAETVQYTFEDSSSKWLQKHARKFSAMTDVFLLLAEYGVCAVYFIFVSVHLAEIVEAAGWRYRDYRVILAIILVPMWLSTFLENLKLLTIVSVTANVIMWVGIFFLLYFACSELPSIKERPLISDINKLPFFFGIMLFAFEGITFIIPLRMEMRHPEKFTSRCGVLNTSMLVTSLLYLVVGVSAYWQWGEDIKGSAFLNMENSPVSQATKILIAIGVMLSYPLHMYIPFEILYPRFYQRFGPFKHPNVLIYTYRSVAVLVTYGLANISSDLAILISLTGALPGAVLALLLPAILELVMLYGDLTYLIIVKDTAIIVIAIAAALVGTILSIMDLVKGFTVGKEEKDNERINNVTQTSTTYSQ